ncbi:hypothetical protein KSS87_003493, partial [Heliosperma pusillum]
MKDEKMEVGIQQARERRLRAMIPNVYLELAYTPFLLHFCLHFDYTSLNEQILGLVV